MGGEGAEEFRKNGRVFQPSLEVAGAGLDDGTRCEAVRRESRERGVGKVVGRGETVLARRAGVDVGTSGVAVAEQRKPQRTASAVRLSRPGSMPRSLRTPRS